MAAVDRRYSFGSFPAARRRRASSFRLAPPKLPKSEGATRPEASKSCQQDCYKSLDPAATPSPTRGHNKKKPQTAMQNAAYPPQYNAGAQPVPMPEQVGYYAAPAMLGGPVPGRPSYVLPQAPSVGSWPLPPATTQMVPGMAPPPAPAEEPTKVVRAKGVARARWNRDEEERLKKLVDLGVLLRCLHFTETTRVHLTMPGVVSFPILSHDSIFYAG